MKKITLFALILIPFIYGCENKKQNNNDISKISLRFDWTTNMSFVGDIVGMNDFAKKNKIELSCFQAGEGMDPIKLVISNANDFGITTFDKLLSANEKGADLLAIGFINNTSPTVFLTLDNQEFSKPSDFEGKTVGIMPGGSTEFVYRGFIDKTGIDKTKVNEIPAGFDIQGFINKKYDVKLAFIYVENIALDENGIKYNMIEPRNFGVNFPGRVYFAKRSFVENNKELTQKFINTVIEGWDASFKNPKNAVEQLKKYDDLIDKDRELKSFEKAFPYFNGFNDQYLMVDESNLDNMIQLLIDTKLIKEPNYSNAIDLSFVKIFYQK